MKKQKYHANGKSINSENPRKKKKCPRCKSSNTFKSGNVYDCKACGELFY